MNRQRDTHQTPDAEGYINGTVARIVQDRGFAFVRANETDYFLHHSEYVGEFNRLKEKDVVRFIPTEGQKGPRATKAER